MFSFLVLISNIMNSEDYKRRLVNFCEKLEELNRKIDLFEERIKTFKAFENLKITKPSRRICLKNGDPSNNVNNFK